MSEVQVQAAPEIDLSKRTTCQKMTLFASKTFSPRTAQVFVLGCAIMFVPFFLSVGAVLAGLIPQSTKLPVVDVCMLIGAGVVTGTYIWHMLLSRKQ